VSAVAEVFGLLIANNSEVWYNIIIEIFIYKLHGQGGQQLELKVH
jgi:hypothetical protein